MSGSNPKAAAAGSTPGPRGLVTGKEEKKKAGGGVLNRLKARRQAPHHAADDGIGAAVTEQELLALDTIRPEHVLRLSRVTESECGTGCALPSRRAPGSLQPSAELAARGPPSHLFLSGRPGHAAHRSAVPGLRSPPSPSPCWEAVPLELDCIFLGPATPASPWPAPPQLDFLGRGPLSLTGSS